MEKGENIQIYHPSIRDLKALKPFETSQKLVLGISGPDY